VIKDYIYYIIKDKNGLYLTDPYYRNAWSPNPNTARRFMKYEEALEATIKRAGEIIPARVFELEPLSEAEVIHDNPTH